MVARGTGSGQPWGAVCVCNSWGPKDNEEGGSSKLHLLDFVQVHLRCQFHASLRQGVGEARHTCASVSLAVRLAIE